MNRVRSYGYLRTALCWIIIIGLYAYAFAFTYSRATIVNSLTYRPVFRLADPETWSLIFFFLGTLVAVCGWISRQAVAFATLIVGIATGVWGVSVAVEVVSNYPKGSLTASVAFLIFSAVSMVTSRSFYRGD